MVCILQKFVRREFQQLLLDFQRRFARRKPRAVADPEDMCIDGDGRLSKRRIQNYICRLAADSRQRDQLFARAGHLAVMMIDQ